MNILRFFKSFKTNKPILSNKDLNALMLLLEKGIDINTAFEIIEDPSNLEVLNKIKQHLNNGEVLESFICDYLNHKTVYYLKHFIKYTNLINALKLNNELLIKQSTLKKLLLKNLTYP